jgi:hypothetical protein
MGTREPDGSTPARMTVVSLTSYLDGRTTTQPGEADASALKNGKGPAVFSPGLVAVGKGG